MKIFRNLFTQKLSDPEFKRYYFKHCAICPITVQIISAVSASPESVDEIAAACGIPVQVIGDLETADNCCVASVKKLCAYFDIPGPVNCRQSWDVQPDARNERKP